MPSFSKRLIPRGNRIRVMVVDDSVVIRRLVTHALEKDPVLEVVGSAADGVLALERIRYCKPDLITLDIEMPEMNGLELLPRLRSAHPDLRVIMFSTLTERGASATMEALSLGADDYVTKASSAGSLDRSMAALEAELIPKIKQFFTLETAGAVTAVQPPPVAARPRQANPPASPQVVVIGISTGGPTALGNILPQFPAHFPLPILIVQHMPPVFTRLLAERLHATCKLKVLEAAHGMKLEAGHAYIAPGDYHMRLRREGTNVIIALDQGPQESSCRPAVDVLFRSALEIYGANCIAAVLTGMGYDGLKGAVDLNAAGAYVIAQDEESSVVWGMPGAVVNAGVANAVLPLTGVVPHVLKITESIPAHRTALSVAPGTRIAAPSRTPGALH
ncbi:MAG: chemotaxis response regulator protein-glutamate methylesterase [Bryobacteraceae bacterium]